MGKRLKQAQRICAKVQVKLTVDRKKLTQADKRAWNVAIKYINESRQR